MKPSLLNKGPAPARRWVERVNRLYMLGRQAKKVTVKRTSRDFACHHFPSGDTYTLKNNQQQFILVKRVRRNQCEPIVIKTGKSNCITAAERIIVKKTGHKSITKPPQVVNEDYIVTTINKSGTPYICNYSSSYIQNISNIFSVLDVEENMHLYTLKNSGVYYIGPRVFFNNISSNIQKEIKKTCTLIKI